MYCIYQTVVISQLFYRVTVWFSLRDGQVITAINQKILAEFIQIQKQIVLLISSAFKDTAAAVLNIKLYILPVHFQL